MAEALVVGLGVTGRAVAEALRAHGDGVVAVDDRPSDDLTAWAQGTGFEVVAAPDADRLEQLVAAADLVLPAPGLPERHPVFEIADRLDVPIRSELDLAAAWDQRPTVAITGTNGKTTVTMLVTEMLRASGLAAEAVGNTEVPLVAALADPSIDVFVVEASSFRLARITAFAPRVGTWLNFADDHLDVHNSLRGYEEAKARLWAGFGPDQLAVANAEDPVVLGHAQGLPNLQTFGLDAGDWHVDAGRLVGPDGLELVAVDDLWRSLPHDITNALAAAATALGVGATIDGVRSALRGFTSLPHRVELVGESGGVRWFDDSKATAPHATLAALDGFDSVVLIAGGRNKGLDLGALAEASPRLRHVVAIGDAAAEVADAFVGRVAVSTAGSMDAAVARAAAVAESGDVVLLSPGCASFDWYRSYAERGDDFVRAVHTVIGEQP
jgi:UDP-N-acetylmuramoylalanine--D-glutamate ligase